MLNLKRLIGFIALALTLACASQAQTPRSAQACPRVAAPAKFPSVTTPSATGAPVNRGIKPSGFVDLRDGTAVVHGIDVSKYQDEVDFKSVYDCGGRFAYVRLSGGTDPDNELLYRTHWANARNARLLPGPYHNMTFLPAEEVRLKGSVAPKIATEAERLAPAAEDSGRTQARIFIARLEELQKSETVVDAPPKPYLPAALDLSYRPFTSGTAAQRVAYSRVYTAAVCGFVDELRRSSYHDRPVVLFIQLPDYVGYNLASAACNLHQFPIWVSYRPLDGDRFSKSIDPALVISVCAAERNDRCIMEQYTSFGGFAIFRPGAPLDISRFYGTEADLAKFAVRGD